MAQFLEVDGLLSAVACKLAELDHVGQRVEQDGLGIVAVAASTPDFLIEVLDALRHVVVDDPAHIALVDTHSESDGGTHYLQIVLLEALLRLVALCLRQACVIGSGADAVLLQFLGQAFGILATQAVDDASLGGTRHDEVAYEGLLVFGGVASLHAELQVRTVETGDEYALRGRLGSRGEFKSQLLDDILARDAVGRSRQCHHGRLRELLFQQPELSIFRAEVVSPLADAVGFIDGKQGNIHVLEQPVHLSQQLFRRDVQQFQFTLIALAANHGVRIEIVAAIQGFGCDTVGFKGFHLILHQTDERRNHDSRSRHGDGRNLVADALSATGRHEHEGIVASHHPLNDFLLLRTKSLVSKVVF